MQFFKVISLKFPVTVLIAIVTLYVYAGTNEKLYLSKRKMDKIQTLATVNITPQNQSDRAESNVIWTKYFPYAKKFAWSSVDLITLYVPLILVTFDSILWNGYMKKLSIMEMKTTSYGHFYYIHHQYIFGLLCTWSVAINSFARNKKLRKCKIFSKLINYLNQHNLFQMF